MARMMTPVAAALRSVRVQVGGFTRVNCPFCESVHHSARADRNASLAVLVQTGWYKCWRCGTKGRDPSITDDSDDLDPVPVAPAQVVIEDIALPDEFIPLWCAPGDSAMVTARARAYLQRRGVSLDAIAGAGIGYVSGGWYGDRVLVQVRDHGKRAGWVARALSDDTPKRYLNPKGMHRTELLFNAAALDVHTDVPALVEEGVFDALPYWPDGVGCLGKPTHAQTARLCIPRPRPVVVALDGDARKEGWALAMEMRLSGVRGGFVPLPSGSDPGNVDPGWLRAAAVAAVDAEL